MPENIAKFIYGGKLIALRKKDGGIRPITVGYVIRRIVAKCANQAVMNNISQKLLPRQLGVGVKGGLKAAIHSTRRFLSLNKDSSSRIAIKLDFRNAFNSVRRDTMLSMVAKVAPSIYNFCKNVYSFQPILDYHNKEIRSATGMQQGDPLGSLLFCITIQPILERLCSELIIGYLDDITLGGDVKSVSDDFDVIRSEGERLGLTLNIAKCELITRNIFKSGCYTRLPRFSNC